MNTDFIADFITDFIADFIISYFQIGFHTKLLEKDSELKEKSTELKEKDTKLLEKDGLIKELVQSLPQDEKLKFLKRLIADKKPVDYIEYVTDFSKDFISGIAGILNLTLNWGEPQNIQ